jgi:DNA-binding CsgD family transcriptional regulator
VHSSSPTGPDRVPISVAAAALEQRVFVGREAELEVLLDGLRDAGSGRGCLVLLGGEPGIGKTRLANELAARAEAADAQVLWGRCWEAGGAPPYWPWAQVLRGLVRGLDPDELARIAAANGAALGQLLPELADLLPQLADAPTASPEDARFRLFASVSGLLRDASGSRPLLLVFEDLHAADPSSLSLLQFVAAEVGSSSALLLGTYRDVELTPEHPLASTLPELIRAPQTMRLLLSGLESGDVARYIETIAGRAPPADLVAAIHRETGGNPLFVGEVVRLLATDGGLQRPAAGQRWPIPVGVREAIGRRLAGLREPCRRLLVLGAVVGEDFTVDLLERVTGLPAEELLVTLHDAVAARLVAAVPGDPGRFAFAHVLVRDTVYENLLPAERVRLHRDVGEALAALYAGDPEPHAAELAHHYYEAAPAGEVARAIDYAVAAGRRAVRLFAYEEAVRLFRMAQRMLTEHDPDEHRRCEVLLLLGDAQARCGATAQAKETFLAAAEVAARVDDPELLARAALGYAGRLPWLRAGTDRHVIPLLRQALEAVGQRDSILHVRILSRLAGALRDQPSSATRDLLARRAVAMARRLDDPETLLYALLAEWAASHLGPDGSDRQRVLADEVNRLGEQVQDHEHRADAVLVRFVAHMTHGRVWAAREERERMARDADELRQPSRQWYAGVFSQILALQDGRFDDAEGKIESTVAAGLQAQPWDADASRLFALFLLRREQDRLAELEADLRRAPREYPGYRSMHAMLLVLLCEDGRLSEARPLFEQLARDDFAAFPKDNEWLFALVLLADAAVALEDREHAAVLYEQLLPYGHLVALAASEVSAGPVSRTLGVLATALGNYDAAEAHFDDAIMRAQQMGSPPWQAHAQHGYAALLAARARSGDRRRAVQLLTQTLATCDDRGMIALAARVTTLLAKLGARPRQTQPAAVVDASAAAALTPREREVAGLLGEGLSNRAIAARLFVSDRTAETHVQHILNKLGFTSRAQVAAWALREELRADGT